MNSFDETKVAAQEFGLPPLVVFSIYTSAQVQTLSRTSTKISKISNSWNDGNITEFQEFYDLFWLWTLGAYEVLRTMDQHRECFSFAKRDDLLTLKRRVAVIRIPFAKQELRGNGGPVYNELSLVDWNPPRFSISGESVVPDELLRSVGEFLNGISFDDIIGELPTARPSRVAPLEPS